MNIPLWGKAAISIAICEIAGTVGSLFTFSQIPTWYAGLVKPALNPPGWVFGPVWTLLYALMGIAAFLIWQKLAQTTQQKKRKVIMFALGVFAVQLLLNTLWSIIFFGWHDPELAFFELIAMWIAILTTIFYFAPISKTAAYLLIPYILWVTFAGYLNMSIWLLNPRVVSAPPIACTQEALMCPDGSYVSRTGPSCAFAECP